MVHLQQLVRGTWRSVASARPSSASGFRFAVKATAKGTLRYRVLRPADSVRSAGTSPVVTVTVR